MQRVFGEVLSFHLDVALILGVVAELAVSFFLDCITAAAQRIFITLGLQSMAHVERLGGDWVSKVVSARP